MGVASMRVVVRLVWAGEMEWVCRFRTEGGSPWVV